MIIGKALSTVLDGSTITVNSKELTIKNNYGKQDALDKFIAECDKKQVSKFPLIFCVTNKVNDLGSRLQCKTNIVIMTNTDNSWLSKKRTSETFDKIIHPVYEKLIKSIDRDKTLKIVGDRKTRLTYEDIANYGIVKGEIGQKKSENSIASDFIDARVVSLNLEYNNNC